MKCTQCSSKQFIHRKGLPFSVERSDEPTVRIEHFICTNCGHIEWFDLGFLEIFKKNQELIRIKNSEILETDEDINKQLVNIEKLKSEIFIINKTIIGNSSSNKAAKQSKDEIQIINDQLLKLEKQLQIMNIRKSNLLKDIDNIKNRFNVISD